MRVTVKLFAILRERAGASELTLELEPATSVSGAVEAIGARVPQLAAYLPRVAVAVNREYCDGARILHEGDELALIPAVSGGRS